MVLLFMIQDRI